MQKSFSYELIKEVTVGNQVIKEVEVIIDIQAFDEDDVEYSIESVFEVDSDLEVKYEDVSLEDQVKIENMAKDLTNDCTVEAWSEECQGRGDQAYDSYKDSLMED